MQPLREFAEELTNKRFPVTKQVSIALLLRQRPQRLAIVRACDEVLKALLIGPAVIIFLSQPVLLESSTAPLNVVPSVSLNKFVIFRRFVLLELPIHHDPLNIVMAHVA